MVNVTIQQALSSISLMTSPIIDLTSRPKSPKEHQQLKATTTDITTTTTTTLPPSQAPQQSTTEAMMMKRIGELEHIMAGLIQVNKDMEERLDSHGSRLYRLEQLDIPQRVSIEESDSYKSHKDHMQLFEALEKSMNRDHSKELVQDLAEVRKKRKKSHEQSKTPLGSPSHQPPPPPPPAGPSGALGALRASGLTQMPPSPPPPSSTNQESPSKGSATPSPSKTAASAEYQAWTTTDIRLRPSISLTLADLEMDEDMAPDEQVQLSDDEDIRSAHIPMVNLRQGWWKCFEEERPTTSEPAWSIRSSDVPVLTNNWASALASYYSPPPKDSLLAQTGDITTFMDWFHKRRGITELKPQDLPALSISKMKATCYLDVGLEKMVPDDIAAMYAQSGHTCESSVLYELKFFMYRYDYMKKIVVCRADLNEHVIAERDFKYLYPSDFEDLNLLNLQEDFQLRIESYQTQVNLTKPQWTTTGFEYKIDYTVIESPRAVIFWDKYGVQMMMRVNEIHKFSNGTLQQIDEALDYRVKEFRINRLNPGLNMRFCTRKDVDRCNVFMFAIQRRLRTRRIFRNLESFVGGRIREGDYRLLRRTD
nr:hypothetical protein [Tanacetum cinerariifolium]